MAAATKYLLPCTCGQANAVDFSQAGQNIVCTCGRSLEVPAMRVIRTLEPAPASDAPVKGREPADWSPIQGALFAGGVLVTVIAIGLAAYFGWILSQIDASPPPPEDEERIMAEIDKFPVDRMYEVFRQLQKEGIGPRQPPLHVLLQDAANTYTQYLTAALVAAGVGVAMVGASFVLKPKPPTKPVR